MPGTHIEPTAESWLSVEELRSSAVFSGPPPVLAPQDATSICVVFKVQELGAGDGSTMEYSVCCLEASVCFWRVSQVTGSESRTDGLVVPVVVLGLFGDAPTPVSPWDPSASGVVPFLIPSLLVLLITEFLEPHIQTPCVVLNMCLDFGAGLSGVGPVALTEPSSLLFVSGTVVLALLGVCPPLAECIVLIIPVVGAVLSHFEPRPAGIWVTPEVHLLATVDAILGDAVMGSPEAGAAA